MSEEKRATTQPQEGPIAPAPGHMPDDDNAGGDEPVPSSLQNTGGDND